VLLAGAMLLVVLLAAAVLLAGESSRAMLASARLSCLYFPDGNREHQLYKNISMLFLFPVKDGKLSTGVNATFDASCYG